MKYKKILSFIVGILLIIEIISIFLMYKSSNNNIISLDLDKPNEVNSDIFAIMLNDGNGNYVESSSWPSGKYKFNQDKSGCIDQNGNKLVGALKYENNIATVITEKTSSCYLYFDEKIIESKVDNATIKPEVITKGLHINKPNIATEVFKNFYGDDGMMSYRENKTDGYKDLVKVDFISENGIEDNNVYKCNVKLKLTLDTTGIDNMGSFLQSEDAVLHIFANGHNTDYDLSELKNTGSKEINVEIESIGSNYKNIRGYLELRNKDGNTQTYLAGKNLNVNIDTEDISCTKTGKAVEGNNNKIIALINQNNGVCKEIKFVNNLNTTGGSNITDLTETSTFPHGSVKGWVKDNIIYIGSNDKIFVRDMESLVFSSNNSTGINNSITTIDLSNLVFDRTTDMSYFFYGNAALNKVIFPQNIDTSKVTNMSAMFGETGPLTSIDLNVFDTSNVTTMNSMFVISRFSNIDISNFDVSKVTDMHNMFTSSRVTSLDLSNFSLYSVKDMTQMFSGSTDLRYLDLRCAVFGLVKVDNIFERTQDLVVIVRDEMQILELQKPASDAGVTLKIYGQ